MTTNRVGKILISVLIILHGSTYLDKALSQSRPELMEQVYHESIVPFTGSKNVKPKALEIAGALLKNMLLKRPDIVERLRNSGAVVGVFAGNENVCDLIYFYYLRGLKICD